MPYTLEQIPFADVVPAGAPRTRALSGLPVTSNRRVVLRALTLGALTVGGVVADLGSRLVPGGGGVAHAETGPGGLLGWDRNDCQDAYPGGYGEQSDNVGAYIGYQAACFGGDYRGSTYCSSGWHRSGTVYDAPVHYTYSPSSSYCGSNGRYKNAWRWTTPSNGLWWRCSDGHMTVSAGGTSYTYFTICRY
ncbi:hypothetical protein ACPPVO_05460 [Dactylosporangium sp. McL0621]|uniref:hypothetical protein n=1 Tax=Dactylosporangium sp. McL0621 TaxID=3415678 RepID=UPI003CE90846